MAQDTRPNPLTRIREFLDRGIDTALAESDDGTAYTREAMEPLLRQLQELDPDAAHLLIYGAYLDCLYRRVDEREDGEDSFGNEFSADLVSVVHPERGLGFRRRRKKTSA